MERVLDSKPRHAGAPPVDPEAQGSEGPLSRKRGRYRPPDGSKTARSSVAYAELHAHSAFSFLDGASTPEELVEEAARLDLRALGDVHSGLHQRQNQLVGVGCRAKGADDLPAPSHGEPA